MAKYNTISEFTDAVRNYQDNASKYQHLSDEQLAQIILDENPSHRQWLNNTVLQSLDNIDTSSPVIIQKQPLDGNAPSSPEPTGPKVDRNKFGITDSRHWRKYPEYDNPKNHSIPNPLQDLIIGVGTEMVIGGAIALEGIPNALVQQFHLMFRPDGVERTALGRLNRIQQSLNDPNVDDRHKNYLRTNLVPYYEERYRDAVKRAEAIDAGDESGGLYSWIYESGVPMTEMMNSVTQEMINETIAWSPHYRRLQKWYEDDPWGQTWSDYINPVNWSSGMAQMSTSVGLSFGPQKVVRGLQALRKVAKLQKGKKTLDRLENVFGNGWAYGTMYLLENSEVQRETLGYLMNDFEWVDINGNPQKGLPFEEAIGPSTIAATSYGLVAGWVEKWQINRIAENLGVAKGARRSLLHNLVHKFYKELPRNKAGKIVYEGIDGLGKFWENAHIEGMQAYASHVAAEAVKQGYNLEDEVGFGEFLNDAGVSIQEIGIRDLVLPGLSEIPQIREAYFAGGYGSGAGISTMRYGLGFNQDKVLQNAEEAHKNGDKIITTKVGDGHIAVTNTTTGDINYVAVGNNLEQDAVINKFVDNANDGKNTVDIQGIEINGVEDYLDVMINNSMTTSGYTNQQIINQNKSFWDDDKKLNKVQKLFKKHAFKDNGFEIDDYKKVADLIQLTGNGNLLKDKILNIKGDIEKSKLSSIGMLASQYIRENIGKKLKNKVVIGDMSQDLANETIDTYVQDLKNLNDEKMAEAFAGGSLESILAGQINEDPALKDKISFADEAFKQPVSKGDPRNLTPKQKMQDLIQSKTEDAFRARFDLGPNSDHIDLLVAENKRNPIVALDQQNATGRALEAHLGSILINSVDAGIDHLTGLKEVLLGQESSNTVGLGLKIGKAINNTNLGRLLSHLKIDFKSKTLQSADGKLKLIDAAVQRIDARMLGSKVKIEPAQGVSHGRVITPISKLEKAVDKKAMEVKKPVKKAPAKKPTHTVTFMVMDPKSRGGFKDKTMTIADAKERLAHLQEYTFGEFAEYVEDRIEGTGLELDAINMETENLVRALRGIEDKAPKKKAETREDKIAARGQVKIDKIREKFPEEEGYEIDSFEKDVGKVVKRGESGRIKSRIEDSSLPKGKKVVSRVISPAVRKDGKIVKQAEYEVSLGTRELTQKEIDAQYEADIKDWKEEVKVAKELGIKIPLKPVAPKKKAPAKKAPVSPKDSKIYAGDAPIVYDTKTPTRKDGHDIVGAQTIYDSKGNVKEIRINPEVLKQKYKEKAWTKPKVEGVDALPENSFKTYEEFEVFVIGHEQGHALHGKGPQRSDKKAYAANENKMNQIGLEAVDKYRQLKKPTDKIEVTIMGETETMTRAEAENELRVARTEIGPPSMRTEEDNETLEKIRGLEEALGIAEVIPAEEAPLPDFTKPISEQAKEGIITSSEIEGDVIDTDTIDLGSDIADSIEDDIDKICP